MSVLQQQADEIRHSLLPSKSKEEYLKEFDNFKSFCRKNGHEQDNLVPDSALFLLYFHEMGGLYAPSTLWSKFSKLKSCCQAFFNINIDNISPTVKIYLKKVERDSKKSKKKASIFSSNDIKRYISEFPDDPKNLRLKVICILGVFGCLRVGSELFKIEVNDVKETEEGYKILFSPAKTRFNVSETLFFIVPRTDNIYNPAAILDKYIKLIKPAKTNSDTNPVNRFVKNWNVKGKGYIQNSGIENVKKSGVLIAELLKLDDPTKFTSHCFRRTAATICADNGASFLELKRIGRWNSDTVASGYVDSSLCVKRRQASLITGEPISKLQRTEETNEIEQPTFSAWDNMTSKTFGNIQFNGCTIPTLNINYYNTK